MDVFQAVRNGEIDNIRRWLDRGGDIQARERGEGYSLVMTAVDAGHLKLADELRQRGAVFTADDATAILTELCGAISIGDSQSRFSRCSSSRDRSARASARLAS
jgi:hypothetical protein